MTIEVDTVTLPAHWACALINGDESGLDDSDLIELEAACCRLDKDGWYVVSDVEDSERFTWQYWLYAPESDCAGGSVLDYVVHRQIG